MEQHEWTQLSPEQQEHIRMNSIIAAASDIKAMLERQGWTVIAIDHKQDNPFCGSVTAGKDDIQSVTLYFAYYTLADIDRQFKRISGET